MRIYIKKRIQIPEIPSEMEIEGGTLRDLLDRLFRGTHFSKELIDPVTGELMLDGLVKVQVNDIPYHSLPRGLDSELHDGDTLTLSLILIGGG